MFDYVKAFCDQGLLIDDQIVSPTYETLSAALLMNTTLLILAIIYGLSMLVFFILFLVVWFRNRQKLRVYRFYGFLAGGILIGLQLVSLATAQTNSSIGSFPTGWMLIPGVLIDLMKMIIFTTVGISYATELGYPSVSLISKLSNSKFPKDAQQITRANQALIYAVLWAGAFLLYSAILFKVTSPEIGEAAKLVFGNGASEAVSLSAVLFTLVFAFGEEIIFRLGIQNYLAKCLNWHGTRYWLAIAVTSVLWSLGHAGSLNPDWVKFAQIFPIGLCLGWLFRKCGIESCILAHSIFNVSAFLFLKNLVRF